jgi:uncharacterized membrane protein YeaQ/YmgE (transglycosylase-associated protein family)
MDIAVFIIIGVAVGWASWFLMDGNVLGPWGSVGVGAAGGLAGGIIFQMVMVIVQTLVPPIAAVLGAALAVMIGGQFMTKRRKARPKSER